ncbi:MAG: LEPR-XLL domain-containing protein, partial [Rhodobacteraceae bacterium]|nr:LEPR-XLL domain-containing protein [Paracoccaceae bacterium]
MGHEGKVPAAPQDGVARRRAARSRARTALASAFQFESLENRLLLSADFLPVDARLSVPGETDTYTFTLTEPRSLLLDARDAPPGLSWTLSTEAGEALAGRSFEDSAIALAADPVLALGPGSYRLTVSGTPGVEGDYGFRLIDIAASEAVEPGTPIDLVQEAAREARVLHFDAVEGAQYEIVAPGFDAEWQITLIAPSGKVVEQRTALRNWLFDRMEETGRYRLVIEGARSQAAPGAVSLLLQQAAGPLSEAAETRFAASLDTPITGTTWRDGGRVHVHEFTLAEATTLFWRGGAGAEHIVSLRGPDGAHHVLPVDGLAGLRLEAGAWELRIEAVTVAPVSYDVMLRSAASAVQVPAGTDAQVNLPNLSTWELVAIDVAGPGPLTLTGSYTNLQVIVIAPDGTIVADASGVDAIRVAAEGAGTFLVALRKTAPWRGPETTLASAHRDWTAEEVPVAPGHVISGTLEGGEVRLVRVIGDGSPLLIDGWPASNALRWEVTGPDTGPRTTFFFSSTSLTSSNPGRLVLPTEVGKEYLITFRNVGTAVIDVDLALPGFADAPVLGAAPLEMLFDPGHRLQLVRLDPAAGQDRVLVEGSVGRALQLYDAEGRPLGAQAITGGLLLPQGATGPLWLAIEPPAPITSAVRLVAR